MQNKPSIKNPREAFQLAIFSTEVKNRCHMEIFNQLMCFWRKEKFGCNVPRHLFNTNSSPEDFRPVVDRYSKAFIDFSFRTEMEAVNMIS